MANWIKRSSKKGGQGSRTTKTTNIGSGTHTRSQSTSAGSVRITKSVKSGPDGTTVKTYITQHNKGLGSRRITKTVSGKTKQPKAVRTSKVRSIRRSKKTQPISFSAILIAITILYLLYLFP